MRWSDFLILHKYATSRKEAERLIAAGALSVDGIKVSEDKVNADLLSHRYRAVGIRLGKHRFGTVLFESGKAALLSREPLIGVELKRVGDGWRISKGPAPTFAL